MIKATRFRKGDYVKFASGSKNVIKLGRVDGVSGDIVTVMLPNENTAEIVKDQCYKATAKEYNQVLESIVDTVPTTSSSKVPKIYADLYKDRTGDRNCGDFIAQELKDMDIEEVYQYTTNLLGVDEKILRDKFQHLNPGMQRMNLGNRCRFHLKNAESQK